MYYDFIQKNKRKIIIGIFLCLILIFSLSLWTFIDRSGKNPLVVSVVPGNATVLINEQKKGRGTHYLPSGTYTVEVKKDGFESQKKSIIVSDKKEQNVIAISLAPRSDEAKKWAENHASDYKKNEEFGAIEAEQNGKYFTQLHPITKQLPYIDPYFTISYISNPDMTIAITIDTPSPRYRYYAVAKIRSMGYDPTDFVIQFKDFKNPLEAK